VLFITRGKKDREEQEGKKLVHVGWLMIKN
jgi:hypothetical protein